MYAWEFEKGGRELRVRVEGQFTFNATGQILNAALAGAGLAYVPESMVAAVISPRAVLSECSRTGACLIRATTCSIQADASPRRRLPWWSMRCVIGYRTRRSGAANRPTSSRRGRSVPSERLSDRIIASVAALYFLKCADSRCDLYAFAPAVNAEASIDALNIEAA